MAVLLHVDDPTTSPEAAAIVRATTVRAMDALGVEPTTEVAVVLTTDTELRRLNHAFRGLDHPTDVLSFPVAAADIPPGETLCLGDILIAVPIAATNARRHGHGLADELALLAVHGLLHLLGHEDDTEAGAEDMRHLEAALGVRSADNGA